MTERDWNLPPTLDAALREHYTGAKPQPAFANRLEKELAQHHAVLLKSKPYTRARTPRRDLMKTLRTQPVLAVILVIVAILILTGVAYAVGRMTGFIPGFGFTADSRVVYVLEEPVEVADGQISMILTQAISSEEEFSVQLEIHGLYDANEFDQGALLLLNGDKIDYTTGSGSDDDQGNLTRIYHFPAVSPGIRQATFIIQDASGKQHTFPLKLRPIEPDEFLPGISDDISAVHREYPYGVKFVIDNVTADADKTIFQISLRSDELPAFFSGPWSVTLHDQNGDIYPVSEISISQEANDGNSRTFQTNPFSGNERLTLTIVSFPDTQELTLGFAVPIFQEVPDFIFDPGPDPEAGQTWELNDVITAGNFTLRLVGAELIQERELELQFEKTEGLTSIMIYSDDPDISGNHSGPHGSMTTVIRFRKPLSHPVEFEIKDVYYTIPGPVQIEWTPPKAPAESILLQTPTSMPTPVPTTGPLPEITDLVILEAVALAERFDSQFQQGSGWIHEVSEKTTNISEGQTYPPPYLIQDNWFEIDAEGYIIRAVRTDKDEAGNILQQSVTIGDFSMNLTTGEASTYDRPPYRYSADRFTFDLTHNDLTDTTVTREDTLCENGQPCVLFTVIENYPQPIEDTNEGFSYSGFVKQVWMDANTGQQHHTVRLNRLANGEKLLHDIYDILTIEKVDSPPQEILDILDNVQVP